MASPHIARIRHRLLAIAGAALFAAPAIAYAQAPETEAEPATSPAEDVLALEEEFELSPEQRERLEKYLPNSLKRLNKRAPMHIVAIGDSVTRYISHDDHENNTHFAYEGVFASELAKLFFYTGSVRDIAPREGQPAKRDESAGPEITIENMGLGGRVSAHALARVTTDAFDNGLGILAISYGINDAYAGEGLIDYLRPFEECGEIARAKGNDVFFVGPSTILGAGTDLSEMARTRHYSSALEDLAAKLGIFYFDYGAVTTTAPGIDPEVSDDDAITAYNKYLTDTYHTHSDGIIDHLHPSEGAHRIAGTALYKALLAPQPSRYRVGGFATLDGKGGIQLEFKVKNLTDKAVQGRVFTPSFLSFKADQTSLAYKLNPGKGQSLIARYHTADGSSIYALDGSEPLLRVPLLVADEEQCRSYVVAAELHPFAPVWKLSDIDDLTDRVPADFTVYGAAGKTLAGKFKIDWGGRTAEGSFTAASPSKFSLPLPSSRAIRSNDRLIVDLSASDGTKLQFRRGLEVSRNLGLEQAVAMARTADYNRGGGGDAAGDVIFRASADAAALKLVFEISKSLARPIESAPPYLIEFQLDARPYGKRRKSGFTDFVRITPLDDGSSKVNALRPAVFGNGYGRKLDRAGVKTRREVLPSGGERVTITIPRTYFYLHEWALGNGNSLLGINARVALQNAESIEIGPFPLSGLQSLVAPDIGRHNAEALGILELSERPTKRWSARLY